MSAVCMLRALTLMGATTAPAAMVLLEMAFCAMVCMMPFIDTRSKQFCFEIFLVDTDECEEDIDSCDLNSMCTNTIGSYQCTCNIGFFGNGFHCSEYSTLAIIGTLFYVQCLLFIQ